jgi:chromate transporter
VPVAFFLAAFILNGVIRWPLLLVLGILAPLALIWAWPRERAVG